MAFIPFFVTLLLASQCLCFSSIVIPSTTATGPSKPTFTSSVGGLDSPHLSAVNSSSFQWWYFDVVAPKANATIVIVFYAVSASAFPFVEAGDITTVQALINYPDGTVDGISINASQAVVTTIGEGSTGHWDETGSWWVGTPNLSSYTVAINSPNITGTVNMASITPGHYPCGPAKAFQDLQQAPGLGWTNAVPDSIGVVDFTLHGKHIEFTGSGYHDQNWAVQSLFDVSAWWYWGHGRIGAYSIVWYVGFDVLGNDNVSAYVSKDGVVLTNTCKLDSITIRPIGSSYPPTPGDSQVLPTGFHIAIDLGVEGTLTLNANIVNFITELAPYVNRWTGSLNGTVKRGAAVENLNGGYALFEQFVLS